jgi:ubiquitin-like modifier-activating enzyme ATG7
MAMQFQSLSCAIDVVFWHLLAKKKLEELKLDASAIPITACYSVSSHPEVPARLQITSDSLLHQQSLFGGVQVRGQLKNFNTREEFVSFDRASLLKTAVGEELNSFVLATYADLKQHTFSYMFCFPMAILPQLSAQVLEVSQAFNEPRLRKALCETLQSTGLPGFFNISENEGSYSVTPLDLSSSLAVGFVDPCPLPNHPAGVVRNLLARLSKAGHSSVRLLAVKDILTSDPATCSLGKSRVFDIQLPGDLEDPKYVGWEANAKGKLAPRVVNLKSQMDPVELTNSAVDLNLKLMRWRMLPDLNLDKLAATKVLLFGAGTLGCQLARNLLAWGVRHFTFVDCGKVAYSNPVRQSLYSFEDSVQGQPKAEAAAANMAKIYPGVHAKGYSLEIPMPGHSVRNREDAVQQDVSQLRALVEEHDVIYLLTDTRESRWLPTLLGSLYDKLVISAALGFDSFLVMRHGQSPRVGGDRLGCYFCYDIVAPRNSTADRTLDQQCTVTRPGLSYQAAAITSELTVSLLHHPDGNRASYESSTMLGELPHQVRGSFHSFSVSQCHGPAFSKCTACSEGVLREYEANDFAFLAQVFEVPDYLEQLCGLDQIAYDEDAIIEIAD